MMYDITRGGRLRGNQARQMDFIRCNNVTACVHPKCRRVLPLETACYTHTHTHTHSCPPTTLPRKDRLSAAIGVSADSLLSFSADRDPLGVAWWLEW